MGVIQLAYLEGGKEGAWRWWQGTGASLIQPPAPATYSASAGLPELFNYLNFLELNKLVSI